MTQETYLNIVSMTKSVTTTVLIVFLKCSLFSLLGLGSYLYSCILFFDSTGKELKAKIIVY